MELIEEAKKRCTRVMERVERLDTSKITASCKGTLLKLASSELNFLSSTHLHQSLPLSVNIGHLEAVVHILEQPFITGVSRVCKPFPLSPTIGNGVETLLGQDDLINFDTTALIAVVSGISNGGIEKLLAAPETEMRLRFKGNYKFVIAQVLSEIQNPIHVELSGLTSGKRGIICETVHSEFKELVSMCGGPYEKLRADQLLKCLMVVPDSPSARMMGLPTTRKLALKNKVVFGTGDYWHAPTLTANMAFVRAISQTGMSLFTIEHRPRALTGN